MASHQEPEAADHSTAKAMRRKKWMLAGGDLAHFPYTYTVQELKNIATYSG